MSNPTPSYVHLSLPFLKQLYSYCGASLTHQSAAGNVSSCKRVLAGQACGAENANVPFWIVAFAGASRSCRKHKLMVQELLGELVFHEKLRKGYHGNKSLAECMPSLAGL